MTHCYVVTAQPATAVTCNIVCSFTGPNLRELILAKGNHLEVHTLTSGSAAAGAATRLQQILDATVHGKIVSIDKFRPSNSQTDYLFLLTERKNFCILGYDALGKRLMTFPLSATDLLTDQISLQVHIAVLF